MKPNSIKPAHHRRQSAAGVIRLQRIYPSCRRQFIRHRRTSGRTCVVSDSGGHQSASGGSAGGSASPTPARLERPSPLNTPSSPLNQQLPSPNRIPSPSCTPAPLSRRQHCSSCTYPTENPRVYGILLIMRSKPNFQKSRLSVTLAMIRTYNETCPKTHKKSKPNPNPIQTQCKPNPNPTKPNFYPQFYRHLQRFTAKSY